MTDQLRRIFGILVALVFMGVSAISPAEANSSKSKPKQSGDEYHAKLKSLALPGRIVGKSANRGHLQITLNLVAVADDEDHLDDICARALKYRDALLTEFHKTPVSLNKRGGYADQTATMARISTIMKNALGNEMVTGIRLASENVADYADKTVNCSR